MIATSKRTEETLKAIAMAALVVGLVNFTAPDQASSAEIRLISMPGMKVVLDELGPQFERASGHKLAIRYGLLLQFKDTIDAGEFDAHIWWASRGICQSEEQGSSRYERGD